MRICSMLQVRVYYSYMVSGPNFEFMGRSYATFDTKIPVIRANSRGAFWVQNGKNDRFTKMSEEL